MFTVSSEAEREAVKNNFNVLSQHPLTRKHEEDSKDELSKLNFKSFVTDSAWSHTLFYLFST